MPSLIGDAGAALIDWIAGLLVRTQLHAIAPHIVAKEQHNLGKALWLLAPKEMTNLLRRQQFHHFQDLLSRPKFRWRAAIYSADKCVVLTDYPVLQTLGKEPIVIVLLPES